MKEKKKHPVLTAFLWLSFLGIVALVIYLSFQNGEEAKKVGQQAIQYIARMQHPEREVTQRELDALTYEIRQTGRVVAFFVIGILGTIAVHVTCKRRNWVLKTGLTAMVLVAIAYLTEKLKIYIPSRHYSYEEMLMSIEAVIMGFLLVSLVSLIAQMLKDFFRLMTAVH